MATTKMKVTLTVEDVDCGTGAGMAILADVHVTADFVALAKMLGRRAVANKNKDSVDLSGAVSAKAGNIRYVKGRT